MKLERIYEVSENDMSNSDLLLQETLFHNANGYIGVRGCLEEGVPDEYDTIRGTYINGFYDIAEMKQAEKLYGLPEKKQTMVNIVDSQTILLFVEGEKFSLHSGKVLKHKRVLDMNKGITKRYIIWQSPKGKEVEIEIIRMTSYELQSLFSIEYSVKALNFEGRVELHSTHEGEVTNYCNPNDPRVAGEAFNHLTPEKAYVKSNISLLKTKTVTSKLTTCTAVYHECTTGEIETKLNGHQSAVLIKTNLKENESINLKKYTIITDSIREKDCEVAAIEYMNTVIENGLGFYYEKQEFYLQKFWEISSIKIVGDDDLSSAVNYNLYQLLQSVSKDEFGNIAAKGLSGEGYEGHYFWDTEMYIQPFFVLTNPEISKNLIAYRYEILEKARENAKTLGHDKGVLFPWRTINGEECSGYYPAGTAQYHINSDIAYAIVAYYLATDDVAFMKEKGAEILIETARLWCDLGNYYNGRFELHAVTGPDEYTCVVNNNYYTNVAAKYNLEWAVKIVNVLKEAGSAEELIAKTGLTNEELEEFENAAQAMYLPYDEETGINPQDDSFLQKKMWDIENTDKDKFPLLLHYHPLRIYRYQVCKQADTVLAHFIYEDEQSIETIEKSFEYYEKVTTHDSSLSTCIYSIVASKLKKYDRAYEYFGESAKLDLFNTHKNTKDGIHTANMGGTFMTIVYGFGGFRLKESGVSIEPYLPESWESYEFAFQYRGKKIVVTVEKDKVTCLLENGSECNLKIFDKQVKLLEGVKTEYLFD